jgi:hypothetical protein
MGDLTSAMQFTAPDDGNMQDHTVMQVKLPRAIAPGETVTFHMKFHDKFPISIERNGYKRDFIMGGQWFPKVGVWWHGAWNCHQYHASTEFFADFGTYRRQAQCTQRYIVGASGISTGVDHLEGRRHPDPQLPRRRHSRFRLGRFTEFRHRRRYFPKQHGPRQAARPGPQEPRGPDPALSLDHETHHAEVRRVVRAVPL